MALATWPFLSLSEHICLYVHREGAFLSLCLLIHSSLRLYMGDLDDGMGKHLLSSQSSNRAYR